MPEHDRDREVTHRRSKNGTDTGERSRLEGKHAQEVGPIGAVHAQSRLFPTLRVGMDVCTEDG